MKKKNNFFVIIKPGRLEGPDKSINTANIGWIKQNTDRMRMSETLKEHRTRKRSISNLGHRVKLIHLVWSRFTILELLVVIAIITILTALLLPSLSKAKELTRGVECQSHLRQFGLVSTQYSNDYNEYTLTYSSTISNYAWWYTMGPYLNMGETTSAIDKTYCNKNTLYTCPSHRWREGSNKNIKGYYGRCYGINYHFNSACSSDYFSDGKIHPKLFMVKNPSLLIYFLESDNPNVITSPTFSDIYGDIANSARQMSDGGYYVEPDWHNKYPNQLRFDGHVDKTKWGMLLTSLTETGAKTWNLSGTIGKR